MLNTTQIAQLASDLITQVDLTSWLHAFEWEGQALEPAWARRLSLESTGWVDHAEHYGDRVHTWGFGHVVQTRVRQQASYVLALRTLCEIWSQHTRACTSPLAIDSLAALLGIRYLGIARVSKFICFLSQERYAIYDSRVSYALKDLSLDGCKRVFPFVGGKQVKHTKYVLADPIASDAQHMAVIYAEFLRLLQRVAEQLNAQGGIADPALQQACGPRWTPALLEMALFMAGQHREKTPKIRQLDTSLWKRNPEISSGSSAHPLYR